MIQCHPIICTFYGCMGQRTLLGWLMTLVLPQPLQQCMLVMVSCIVSVTINILLQLFHRSPKMKHKKHGRWFEISDSTRRWVVGTLCWGYVERSRSGHMVSCWIGDVGIMIAWKKRGEGSLERQK